MLTLLVAVAGSADTACWVALTAVADIVGTLTVLAAVYVERVS